MILSSGHHPAESSSLETQVAEIFGPGGLLSKSKNFEYRPQQQAMATGVARALEAGKNCVVEAGTGVGKSLAYLIPAILHGQASVKKAIISTHTINLQEQLSDKDLPMLQNIPPVDFSYTLLKPFKPVIVAKVHSFELKANCEPAPNGRPYFRTLTIDVDVSALGKRQQQTNVQKTEILAEN